MGVYQLGYSNIIDKAICLTAFIPMSHKSMGWAIPASNVLKQAPTVWKVSTYQARLAPPWIFASLARPDIEVKITDLPDFLLCATIDIILEKKREKHALIIDRWSQTLKKEEFMMRLISNSSESGCNIRHIFLSSCDWRWKMNEYVSSTGSPDQHLGGEKYNSTWPISFSMVVTNLPDGLWGGCTNLSDCFGMAVPTCLTVFGWKPSPIKHQFVLWKLTSLKQQTHTESLYNKCDLKKKKKTIRKRSGYLTVDSSNSIQIFLPLIKDRTLWLLTQNSDSWWGKSLQLNRRKIENHWVEINWQDRKIYERNKVQHFS